MKTLNVLRAFTMLLMLVFVSGMTSYAKEPVKTPADHLQKMIRDGIKYPEQAVKSCCTGTVDVVFKVDDDGKIVIEKTNAESAQLEKMAKEQLASICVKGLKVPTYAHYKIRITFKLVG
jgi:outer membrane biosynthesis protein TonB